MMIAINLIWDLSMCASMLQVSSLGFIPIVMASMGLHQTATDVVKSACHTLAILSDVKGQASCIAVSGQYLPNPFHLLCAS